MWETFPQKHIHSEACSVSTLSSGVFTMVKAWRTSTVVKILFCICCSTSSITWGSYNYCRLGSCLRFPWCISCGVFGCVWECCFVPDISVDLSFLLLSLLLLLMLMLLMTMIMTTTKTLMMLLLLVSGLDATLLRLVAVKPTQIRNHKLLVFMGYVLFSFHLFFFEGRSLTTDSRTFVSPVVPFAAKESLVFPVIYVVVAVAMRSSLGLQLIWCLGISERREAPLKTYPQWDRKLLSRRFCQICNA